MAVAQAKAALGEEVDCEELDSELDGLDGVKSVELSRAIARGRHLVLVGRASKVGYCCLQSNLNCKTFGFSVNFLTDSLPRLAVV